MNIRMHALIWICISVCGVVHIRMHTARGAQCEVAAELETTAAARADRGELLARVGRLVEEVARRKEHEVQLTTCVQARGGGGLLCLVCACVCVVSVCACLCVRVCVRACVRACVSAHVGGGGDESRDARRTVDERDVDVAHWGVRYRRIRDAMRIVQRRLIDSVRENQALVVELTKVCAGRARTCIGECIVVFVRQYLLYFLAALANVYVYVRHWRMQFICVSVALANAS